jgi:hypothetical protein
VEALQSGSGSCLQISRTWPIVREGESMIQQRTVRLLLSAAVFVLSFSTAQAETKSFIKSGESLNSRDANYDQRKLVSANGTFILLVNSYLPQGSTTSPDPNLSSYGGFEIRRREWWAQYNIWRDMGRVAPHTQFGKTFADHSTSTLNFILAMQPDGNLCLYHSTVSDAGRTWCSMATASYPSFFAIMQDDGNLCVYKGTGPADNHGGVWCSGTDVK